MSKRGFTLLELLLVVAMITIVAGIAIPLYRPLHVRNDLHIAIGEIAGSARRAQALSQAVVGDSSWGVRVQLGSVTVFNGASYASRDSNFDEVFAVPTSITPSGLSEIVFAKFTGTPQTLGTITLTTNINETKTLTINAKGTIIY